MVYSLKSVSKKIRKNNKPIIISCICSVVVAILIILSIFNLTTNAKSSYVESVRQEFGDFDYIVGENEVVIPDDIENQINNIPGVSDSSAVCVRYIPYSNISIYAAGVEDSQQSKSYYRYKHSLNNGEIIINKSFASFLQKDVGDYITINNDVYVIREVISESKNAIAEVNMAIFTLDDLRKGQGISGCNYIFIKLNSNADKNKFMESYQELGTYPITGLLDNDKIMENLQIILYIVWAMMGIVIVTSAFLLTTIFQRFYNKYSQDFSTIRSIGGSQKQAVGIIKSQINFIIIIGISTGFILAAFFNRFILNGLSQYTQLEMSVSEFPWEQDLAIALICGLSLRIIFALFNIRNNKIMPVKIGKEKRRKKTIKLYVIITILGCLLSGLFFYEAVKSRDIGNCMYSIVVLIITCYLCSPLYIDYCLIILKKLLEKTNWRIGKISIDLLRYHIRKNTLVVLTIASMMFLMLLGNQFLAITNQISINHYKDAYITDFIISENRPLDYNAAMKLYDNIKSINNTNAFLISTQNIGQLSEEQYITYSFGDINQMKEMDIIEVDTDDLINTCILDAKYADDNHIKINDFINFKFTTSTINGDQNRTEMTKALKVQGIVEGLSSVAGEALVDLSNKDILQAGIYTHFLDAAGQGVIYLDGESKEVSKELEELKKQEIGLQWSSFQDVKNNIIETSNQRWRIFSVVLYFVIVVTVCGIINTIQMGINMKRKEYALLRTMRMKPSDISTIITMQTAMFIVIGGTLGIALGYIILNMILITEVGYIQINIYFALIGIVILMLVSFMALRTHIKKVANSVLVDELDR